MRTLEVALEEPETALRIARRAERVILACVGLSPTRREKALELVSAKQRDMTIEPRIRVAACWLAVALASEELPALEESISCLSAPNADDHRARQEFREFVDFIASRSTSLSPDQLTRFWDAFTAVVGTDGSQLDTVSCGLVALAPRLASDQATLGAESIITLLEKASKHPASLALNGMVINLDGRRVEIASDHSTLAESGKVLDALLWRLTPDQVTRAGDAMIAVLEPTTDNAVAYAASNALAALAPRLAPAQVTRGWKLLIAILNSSTVRLVVGDYAFKAAGNGLVALAPRLTPEELTQSWKPLIEVMESPGDDGTPRYHASRVLVALVPKFAPDQVTDCWKALMAVLEQSTDWTAHDAAGSALLALAPRLPQDLVASGGDALIAVLSKSDSGANWDVARDGLMALAERLEPDQVARGGEAFIRGMENTENIMEDWTPHNSSRGLVALAPVLTADQVRRGADACITVLGNTQEEWAHEYACTALAAIAPRLAAHQVIPAWDALIQVLVKSTDSFTLEAAASGLVTLAPRLATDQVSRGGDTVIAILGNTTELQKRAYGDEVAELASSVLVALAPKLGPAQLICALDTLIAIAEKSTDSGLVEAAASGLVGLAPSLTAGQRIRTAAVLGEAIHKADSGQSAEQLAEQLLTVVRPLDQSAYERTSREAMTILLDYMNSSSMYSNAVADADESVRRDCMAMSNARSVAGLLSHAGCVQVPGQFLLQRFEELVLHDGKHVFLTPPEAANAAPSSDHQTPKPESLPRRFHNMHDAAAWIQKNWPDFDLEATYPVIWRGER